MTEEAIVAKLSQLAESAIATQLLEAQLQKICVVTDEKLFDRWVSKFSIWPDLPAASMKTLNKRLKRGFEEIHYWLTKHYQLFLTGNRRFRLRSRHLAMYIEYAVWKSGETVLDHKATALAIIHAAEDWPMLQFQFACAYGFEEVLVCFDKVQFRTFKHQLEGHALFDFWLMLLMAPSSSRGLQVFEQRGLVPHPTLNNVFQWAIEHGFCEVIQFIWWRVAPWQQEYLGMLHWRPLCSKFHHPSVLKFVGSVLYQINAHGVARVTYQILAAKISELNEQQPEFDFKPPDTKPPLRPIDYLIINSFPPIRHIILGYEKRHLFILAVLHKDFQTFKLMTQFVTKIEERANLKKILREKLKENEELLSIALRVMEMDPQFYQEPS